MMSPLQQAHYIWGKGCKTYSKDADKQANLTVTFTWKCHTMSAVVSRNCSLTFDAKIMEIYNNLPAIQ